MSKIVTTVKQLVEKKKNVSSHQSQLKIKKKKTDLKLFLTLCGMKK